MKKIICMIFVFLIAFSALPLSVFAEEASADDIELVAEDLSKTDIEYDFKYVFAGNYEVASYKYDSADNKLHFITAIESESSAGEKEIYIYVYNPSRASICKNTVHNTVSLSVGAVDSYEQKSLAYINSYSATKEGDIYSNGLILKFKIAGVASSEAITRIYKLGEFELLKEGETLPEYSMCAMQYEFTTNELGFVSCVSRDLSVIESKAFHTFYRVKTGGEENTLDTYQDIRAVYFPIPNNYLKAYGKMYYIDAEWLEYNLYNLLICDNQEVANACQPYAGTSFGGSVPYTILFNESKLWHGSNNVNALYYRSAYNAEAISKWIAFDYSEWYDCEVLVSYKFPGDKFLANVYAPKTSTHDNWPITYVGYSSDVSTPSQVLLYGEELLEYYESKIYKNFESPYLWLSKIGDRRFYFEKDAETVLGASERCSWFEALKNDGVYYNKLSEDQQKTFSNFVQLDKNEILYTLTPEQISEKYLVDSNDIAELKATLDDEKYDDCTWFMLRYSVTDYETSNAEVINNGTGLKVANGAVHNLTMVYDFDLIEVAFADPKNAGVYHVFPMGMSPTSSITDLWSPSVPKTEAPDYSWLNDLWAKIERILAIIVTIVFVVIVLKVISMFKRDKVVVKMKDKEKRE